MPPTTTSPLFLRMARCFFGHAIQNVQGDLGPVDSSFTLRLGDEICNNSLLLFRGFCLDVLIKCESKFNIRKHEKFCITVAEYLKDVEYAGPFTMEGNFLCFLPPELEETAREIVMSSTKKLITSSCSPGSGSHEGMESFIKEQINALKAIEEECLTYEQLAHVHGLETGGIRGLDPIVVPGVAPDQNSPSNSQPGPS